MQASFNSLDATFFVDCIYVLVQRWYKRINLHKDYMQNTHGSFDCICTIFCARGVMVIVVGNGHGDTSSNPG